jgi:hypothetical protein
MKRVKKLHKGIYPGEITFMPAVVLRDLDNTSPGAAGSKPNRFMKFRFCEYPCIDGEETHACQSSRGSCQKVVRNGFRQGRAGRPVM